MEKTRKTYPFLLVMVTAAFVLAGCTGNVGLPATPKSAEQDSDTAPQAGFSHFSDIPIPSGAKMDMEKSLVLGGSEAWIGRLVMSASHDTTRMFDFFKQRSGEFGWQEITSVRAKTSVLTFTRAERVMTIQIESRTLSGSEVNITVAPRESSTLAANPVNAPSGVVSPPPSRAPVQRLR